MDQIYRVPLAGHDAGIFEFTIEPNPFGDPHTVRIELRGMLNAWVILPLSLFSDAVKERIS